MAKYTLALDASQIKQFDFCNLSWAYLYRENLVKSGLKTEALDKGTYIHLLLELYYKRRIEFPNEDIYNSAGLVIADVQKNYAEPFNFPHELHQFLCTRFIQYIGYWAGRDISPIGTPDNPAVELGFSKILYEDDNVLFIVEGKIDLIQSTSGAICIVDHKSQDRESHLYYYRPQMLTYDWATGAEYGMINYFGLQKEFKEGKTFRRDTMHFPKWMIQRWEKYLLNIFWTIYKMDSSNEWIEQGTHKKITNEETFQRNLTSCAGAFESNPCMFTDLCEIESDEMRENKKKFAYETKKPWTPWKVETK